MLTAIIEMRCLKLGYCCRAENTPEPLSQTTHHRAKGLHAARISRLVLLLRATVALALFALYPGPAVACTAFQNTNVISTIRPEIIRHRTVLVEGARIISVAPAARARLPRRCVVIDGGGRYLIPGLVDTHVHFFGYSMSGRGDPEVERAVLKMLAANGVTTAVVMEGTPRLLALRDQIASGRVAGPRLFVAGKLIQAPGTGELPGRETFLTPADVDREVHDEKQLGYDFVKIHGAMPLATYDELLRTARANGLPVIGHVPDNLGIDVALRGGQAMIAHAESYLQTYYEFDRKGLPATTALPSMTEAIARRTATAKIFVQPTLSVFRQIIDQVADPDAFLKRPEMRLLPAAAAVDWQPPRNPYLLHWRPSDLERFRSQYSLMQQLVRVLASRGVPLLVGTDDMVPMQLPGFSMKEEMLELEEAGLTPFQVLQAATYNSARFLRREQRAGSIAPGKDADLILLASNPLLDVSNAFTREGVMLHGAWHSEAKLQEDLWNPSPSLGAQKLTPLTSARTN